MRGPFRIEGYAIASADGMIADESGGYPKSLRFDADQKYLRESLDRAAIIVQGRNSGTGQPNWRKRLRLIMTHEVASLAPHPDIPNARFWNPGGASLEEACAAVGGARGTVAIIGGPEVYSYFLQIGYDDFHLSRAETIYLPGGEPLFAKGHLGQKPEEVLASAGLKPGPTQRLEDGVSLVDWRREPIRRADRSSAARGSKPVDMDRGER
jgi:dihydrofolate reductase